MSRKFFIGQHFFSFPHKNDIKNYFEFSFLELNYVLDRNTCIANMMASELADQLPTYFSVELNDQLPHTRASFKIQVKIFAMLFSLSLIA